MASGGPYGVEELVHDSGYKIALAILFLVPLVWSVPVGLMVGELSAAIPAEGGFYVWVRRALGPFWGFQEAWLSLLSSVFDMAVYPTLFVLSLGRLWAPAAQGSNGLFIGALMVLVCVLWNLFGARAVGEGSLVLAALLLSPFVAIVAVAVFRHPSLAAPVPAVLAHRDVLAGILVAMWNYMGWDNASTVAGEVEKPQRTYPRVMSIAIAAAFLSYVIPIAAVRLTGLQPAHWATGGWVSIASALGGPWLGAAMLLTTMISTLGTFNSLTMSYSRIPFAMAEDGFAPRVLTRRLRNGAPWVAIVVCGIAWTAALGLTFDRLLVLDILLYGASLILEFVALVRLRISEPQLHRPFAIPGGLPAVILTGVGPTVLLICALIKSRDERMGQFSALTVGLTIIAVGVLLYFVPKRAGRKRHDPELRLHNES
jgi:amino acid transporter